jgi:hypothetical protein
MFQPKLRRAAASAVLLSLFALVPAHAAAPRSSQAAAKPRTPSPVAVRLVAPVWDFVTNLLRKAGARIDPNGQRLTVRTDSDGNEPSGQDGAQ